MGNKNNEFTKINFFDTYASIQMTKRIEKITVKEICEKAGYNKTTFYKYFSDIYDLRKKLEDFLIKNANKNNTYLRQNNIGECEEEQLIKIFDNYYIPYKKYLMALWGPYGDQTYISMSTSEMKSNIIPLLKNIGMHYDDEYIDYLAGFYAAGHISCIMNWYNSNEQLSSKNIVRILLTIKYDGILSAAQKRVSNYFPLIE